MPPGKKLGLFIGNTALCIVETQQDTFGKVVRIPFGPTFSMDAVSPAAQSEDLAFANTIKESLKANNIFSTDVHLALPSKDIVIRSFVIPLLKSNEIRNVVEFEIKKYIPFNLKDLSYNFHAAPFSEDKIKRMRVHFVAIRKEMLDRYKTLLKLAGLNVVFSEPAPMCLVRALIFKKQVKAEQRVALLQTDFKDSRILIVEHGIVQFVRDFQLQNPALNAALLDVEMLQKKLFNETKISLDFYMRQFKSDKIDEMVTLAFDQNLDLSADLQREIEVAVRRIDPNVIVNSQGPMDVGLISAYGAVAGLGPKAIEFNLSGTTMAVKQSALQQRIPSEYFMAIKTTVACVALVMGVSFLTSFNNGQIKKRYTALMEQQGAFVDMPLKDIQKKVTENRNRFQTYKNFFTRTEASYVLAAIPRILTEGVWLTNLSIQYVKAPSQPMADAKKVAPVAEAKPDGVNVEFSGYAYATDPNQQFKLVYGVVSALKSDKGFQKYFSNVSLVSIQSEQREDITVTSFKISCK